MASKTLNERFAEGQKEEFRRLYKAAVWFEQKQRHEVATPLFTELGKAMAFSADNQITRAYAALVDAKIMLHAALQESTRDDTQEINTYLSVD